jgi:hypothetical protein
VGPIKRRKEIKEKKEESCVGGGRERILSVSKSLYFLYLVYFEG